MCVSLVSRAGAAGQQVGYTSESKYLFLLALVHLARFFCILCKRFTWGSMKHTHTPKKCMHTGLCFLTKWASSLDSLVTRDNPAMSCQDIYSCNGDSFKPGEQWLATTMSIIISSIYQTKSLTLTLTFPPNLSPGFYWIDPNDSSPKDVYH